MFDKINPVSLTALCAALAYTVGVQAPEKAESADERLTRYVDEAFSGRKADRLFMYNPDAVAMWLYEKYPALFAEMKTHDLIDLELPYATVMPSVTPVCFGTMYTGAYPAVHGIQKYEKPVIRIDTLFDALLRAGKKPVILAVENCSMSKIYLEREMDYFIFRSIEEINARASKIILEDQYDAVFVYNGNYDHIMHKTGPESIEALAELRANVHAFAFFEALIRENWRRHDTLVGFAMDHGAHEIDGGCGSHGLDMPEDINICHLYKALPKAE